MRRRDLLLGAGASIIAGRASAAQELTTRRELLLARLRDQGALTLDLDPAQLTSAVLNQYLKVKERAMV